MAAPDATRDQILDAATRVFAEKGYGGARMDDVVAAAGLSKGTVYWHYKSKDGLLAAVMRRFLAIELRRFGRLTAEAGSVADGLLDCVRQVTDDLRHMGPLMPLTLEFYALALRKEWARRYLRGYYAEFRLALARSVQAGIARGEFRPVSVEDTTIALTGLIEGLILLWVVDDQTVEIGHQAEAGVRLVLDGLRRPATDS